MQLRTDALDLWVFWRGAEGLRYLLLQTSQENADRWVGGGRFWQIPGAFLEPGESAAALAILVVLPRCRRSSALFATHTSLVECLIP
jgi:hypothetical protein